MKPNFSKFLQFAVHLIIVCLASYRPQGALATEEPALDREISIEFEAVSNAKSYEIRAQPINRPDSPVRLFKTDKTAFSQRLPLGTWSLEIRSFDHRGVAGRWQPLDKLTIGFKAPTIKHPPDGALVKCEAGKKIMMDFSWDTFHPNAEYELTIQDEKEVTVVQTESIKGGPFKKELAPGKYRWILKSKPPKDITVDGKDSQANSFTISRSALSAPEISKTAKVDPLVIEWKKQDDTIKFQVQLEKILDETAKNPTPAEVIVSEIIDANRMSIPAALKSGWYRFSVSALAPEFEPSETSSITFKISPKKEAKTNGKNTLVNQARKAGSGYSSMDFIQASIGPVIWNYTFSSTAGQKFALVAGTITAIDADITKWFAKSESSSWGTEFRGRLTNIYLFQGGESGVAGQEAITVSDRRLAVLIRKRTIFKRVGVDAILGIGNHRYTYLIQDQTNSVLYPIAGQLVELYVGGALDWQLKSKNHLAFDITFHPVGSSFGISADQTWQYTAILRYMRQAIHDRSFLTLNLENFRSRINTNSNRFRGNAETISNWYRLSAGLGFKL